MPIEDNEEADDDLIEDNEESDDDPIKDNEEADDEPIEDNEEADDPININSNNRITTRKHEKQKHPLKIITRISKNKKKAKLSFDTFETPNNLSY